MFKLGIVTLNLQDMNDWDLSQLSDAAANELKRRKGPAELDIAEKCMVRCGQHIQAIKAYRARIPGTGLREAKDACDAFRNTIPDYKEGKTFWSEAEGRWTHNPNNGRW